ncbi:MAG: hypothetical protein AAFN77_20035 [Planctomycetota bacterium]
MKNTNLSIVTTITRIVALAIVGLVVPASANAQVYYQSGGYQNYTPQGSYGYQGEIYGGTYQTPAGGQVYQQGMQGQIQGQWGTPSVPQYNQQYQNGTPQQYNPYQYNSQQQQYTQQQYNTQQYNTQQYNAPTTSSPQAQTQSSVVPNYRQPIASANGSKNWQGNNYEAGAGIGFDQRTDSYVGGRYDQDGPFVGAGGSVGAGLYGDAGVSQSGQIGKVKIRNYAEGTGFVGTEAGAEAGIGREGVVIGANGFAGGRVSGTVGSDVGPVGYGATGEAWSGLGVEAGANIGMDDGVIRFGGELGGALGVGGKLGVQGSVDVGAIGDGVKTGAQHVGRWGKQAGQEVGDWTKNTAQNIGGGVKKTGQNVGNWGKNTAQNIGGGVKKAGQNIGNGAKKVGGGIKKGFNKVKGIFGK